VDACFSQASASFCFYERRASRQLATQGSTNKRWGIAIAGIVLQVVPGSVYAWSVFRIPLTKKFH
jgi:hypothetical protein